MMKTREAVLCVAAKAFEINEDTRVMWAPDNSVTFDIVWPNTDVIKLDAILNTDDFHCRIGLHNVLNILVVSKITEVKE